MIDRTVLLQKISKLKDIFRNSPELKKISAWHPSDILRDFLPIADREEKPMNSISVDPHRYSFHSGRKNRNWLNGGELSK